MPSTSNIASKSDLTAVENEIPDISNLAKKTALTTVENKIPDITNLATKTATKTALSTVKNKHLILVVLLKKINYNIKNIKSW